MERDYNSIYSTYPEVATSDSLIVLAIFLCRYYFHLARPRNGMIIGREITSKATTSLNSSNMV